MRGLSNRVSDLRFADLDTFLTVLRSGSISGAARELRVTPSQVSKAIARLEQQLRVRLLARGAQGVSLSDAGMRLLPLVEDVVGKLQRLEPHARDGQALTVAAPSYLSVLFLPRIAASRPYLRVRGLELPPALIRTYAVENFFDVTLTVGPDALPGAWVSAPVGVIEKALFAAPALARRLGRSPSPDKLREIPFISPVYNVNGQFTPADDDCPMRREARRIGHEVQTLAVAFELACTVEQLVFGPTIAAAQYVERGKLVRVEVAGWDVRQELALACNAARVLAPVQKAILAAVRETLAELRASKRARPARDR